MAISTDQIQASLKDYLRIIFHRKWFFLIPFLVVFTTATIGSSFLTRYYESSILILVEEEKIINPLIPYQERLILQPKEDTLVEKLRTLTEQILSYPQLINLVNTLGISKGITDQAAYEKLIMGIRKRTGVVMRASDVFQISYEDKDPVMAQKIVNTLINLFIKENLQKKTDSALIGVKFAEEQAKVYKKQLEKAERTLYEFREKQALQLPGMALDMNTQFLISYQTSHTSIELALKEAREELSRINRQLSGHEPVIISHDLIVLNPDVNRLTVELSNLQAELDTKMVEDPEDPEISLIIAKIEEVREKLRLESKKVIDADTALTAPLFYQRLEQRQKDARQKVDELEARRKRLQGLVDEYEAKIGSLPEQERVYAELTRDVRVNQNIYEMLKMKVEESRLTAVELKDKGTRYEILEEGRLPLKPSKPKRLLTSIVAFVIGILSGFGCVFLAEFADHSFRGVEDVKQYIDLPVLGSISRIVSAQEIRRQKVRNARLTWIFIIFLIILIIFAAIYSNTQEQKIKEKLIRQQTMEKQ